ncbi:hypothetical protein D3C71_290430 [compost metagenome]
MVQVLDTTDFEIIRTDDGYFRHVCHEQRMLTSGWGTHEAAERNANIYRGDEAVLNVLRERYEKLYGNEATEDAGADLPKP